jgi:hypothetical protein
MASKIKQITEIPDYYITNTGQVFSTRISPRYNKKGEMRQVRPKLTKGGYLYIGGYSGNGADKKRNWLRIHRVVYQEFVGPIPQGMEIDHINNIKTDNRLENLQMLSKLDNVRKWFFKDKQIRDAKKNKDRRLG